jgi:elongation factor G
MPEPLLPLAVRAATRNGEDSLARALARCVAVDPCLRLDQNARTGQTVVWCLGEAHGDVVLSRLRAGGAQVDMEPVRVELRASFGGPARGHGRQVKQSGGHGQYAVCDIEVEPLPRGAGVEFVDRVVGGAVPSQFIGSVEKGVRHQLEQGLLDTPGRGAAIAVTDVRISLVDGKAHSVDSSDAAFQFAGALAVRDAATHAAIQLLEPIDSVTISVPDEYIGAVLSDLAGRRGRVTGTEPIDTERPRPHTAVHAEVPQAELVRYPITLRSLTGGSGTFVRQYGRHDPVPEALASRLIS